MKKKWLTRRKALRGLVLAGGSSVGLAVLAGCGETQVITETKIQEVIKEVPVEKIVTQIVEKEVVVEKVVTQIVEKEVMVIQEKIVTQIVEVAPKVQSATISYWMQQWDDGVAAFQGAIDSFEAANPMYKVKMNPIGFGDLFAKFYPSITTETSGDVVYTYTDWWYPIDVTKVLHPMTPTLRSRSEFSGIFFPKALDAVFSTDNEFYVVPLICGMGGPICLIDVDAAEAAGIDVETITDSWENLESAFQKATVKDGDRMTTGGIEMSWGRLGGWVQAMIQQLGRQYYDTSTELFNWNTPETEAAVRLTTDTIRNYNSRELIADADGNALSKGTHVTEINGLWKVSSYGNAFPDLNLVPKPMPAFPGAKELVYESDPIAAITIPKFVKGAKLEAARAFMIHLWQPENLAAFGKFYSGSHAVKAVYENEEYVSSQWGRVGVPFMPTKVWPFISFPRHHVRRLSSEWASPLEKVTFDGLPVQDAIFDVEERTSLLDKEALDRFKAGA